MSNSDVPRSDGGESALTDEALPDTEAQADEQADSDGRPLEDQAMDAITEATPDESERPDPSEVDLLDQDAYFYDRDENGDLIPEEDVVEVDGQWRRIKHMPPTKGFLNRLEKEFKGREDVEMEELDSLLADFYAHPSFTVDECDDMDPDLYMALLMHMIQYLTGEIAGDDLTEELADEVEQRQSASGN